MARKKIGLAKTKEKAAKSKKKAKTKKAERKKNTRTVERTYDQFGFINGSPKSAIAELLAKGTLTVKKIQKKLDFLHSTPIDNVIKEAEEMPNLRIKYVSKNVPKLIVKKGGKKKKSKKGSKKAKK